MNPSLNVNEYIDMYTEVARRCGYRSFIQQRTIAKISDSDTKYISQGHMLRTLLPSDLKENIKWKSTQCDRIKPIRDRTTSAFRLLSPSTTQHHPHSQHSR